MSKADPLANLQDYVDKIVHDHKVPAVSIAVWKDDQLQQAASGVLNLNTGVEATTDSIFQIGSITKVMTTCLVMQLVDAGRLDLDQPVKQYLSDFQIADSQASAKITVRQLINHTSGIAGDFFPDDHGHQGNLIARFVDRCNYLPTIHPIGEMYSYCNTSFGIAGRLVEVLTGLSWFQAMEQFIFQPLGMDHAVVNPEETIRFRTAMGHVYKGEICRLADQTYLPMGMAPVGSCATMRALDLITFARAHLAQGRNSDGQPWLSRASVEAMQTPQITQPRSSMISQSIAGLGWGLTDYNKPKIRVVRHNGATSGSLAGLQIIPEQNAAFAILMNGFKGAPLNEISRDLLQALSDIDNTEPAPPDQLPTDVDLSRFVGVYESLDAHINVQLHETQLQAVITPKIDPLPPMLLTLKPFDNECVATYTESGVRSANMVFVDVDETSKPNYVMWGSRLNGRIQ